MATSTRAELCARFRADPLGLVDQCPGILLVHKPSGMTSHDVVDAVRRTLGLQPVMTLTSELIAVRELQPGERIGYGGAFEAAGLAVIDPWTKTTSP